MSEALGERPAGRVPQAQRSGDLVQHEVGVADRGQVDNHHAVGEPVRDSAGLGEVVRTYTTVSRQGGSLKLLNLTKRIEDLLSITKLLTVFETYDSEADAVRSFSSSAV